MTELSRCVDPHSAPELNAFIDESDLLAALYGDVGSPYFFRRFMEQFASRAGLRSGALAICNTVSGEVRGCWSWNLRQELVREYIIDGLAAKDEMVHHVTTAERGQFYSLGIHLPGAPHYQSRGEIYQRFTKPQGIHDLAMCLLAQDGDWVCCLVVQRSLVQGNFSAADLQWLNRFIQPVAQALVLHRGLSRHQQGREDLGSWLSLIKTPVLVFNSRFQCEAFNNAAAALFAQQQSIRLHEGALQFEDAALGRHVAFQIIHTIDAALGFQEAKPSQVECQLAELGCTHFVFLPVEADGDPINQVALVFIYPENFELPISRDALREVFGLTVTEAEICGLLVSGFSLQQIAERQRKSKETVRTQMKHVFAKTETASQSQLIIRLLSHPALLLNCS